MQKAVISIIAAIATLLIITAVVPYLVPSSSYQGYIENKLSKYINARVTAEKIHFQILPYPAFTIRGFSLVSKDAPFQSRPVVTARKIRGSLSPFGLMRGKLVTSIAMKGAVIDCLVSDDSFNLSQLVPPEGPQKKDDGIEMHSLTIINGRLNVLKDGSPVFTVDDLNLYVGNLSDTGKIQMTGKVITPFAQTPAGDLNIAGSFVRSADGTKLEFPAINALWGQNPITLTAFMTLGNEPKLGGKLFIPAPSWFKAKPMDGFFSPDLWKILEDAAFPPLPEETKKKLAEPGEKFENLEVVFEMKNDGTSLNSVSFSHPLYSLTGSAVIESSGAVKGNGSVILSDEISTSLPDLPVVFYGGIPELSVRLDRDKLVEILPKPQEKLAEPEKPAVEEEVKPEVQVQKPKKPPKKKPPPPAKARVAKPPEKPPPPPPEKKESVITVPRERDDEILNVIIGK